jgi:hypothetical protein
VTVDDFIRETAASQYGLIGRRQIRGFGGTRTQVSHRVGKGMLSALTPEVLELVGSPPSDGKTAMAAVLDGPPDAVLSHTSAAAWWDLPASTCTETSMSRCLIKVHLVVGGCQ